MRVKASGVMILLTILVVVSVSAWSLYQWSSWEPQGAPEQADTGREAAEDWARGKIVETAPAFSLMDQYGWIRSSEEWEGQIRVINFWATWCAPCREEVPLLVDLHRAYEDQGVTVLGVALDEPEAVQEFADEFRINYPVLVGESEVRRLAEHFGSDRLGLPHTFVVDRDGEIAGFHLGLMTREDIEPLLESLL